MPGDESGQTPLLLAAMNDDAEVVGLLLANKADVNIKDNSGHSPLDEAALDGDSPAVKLLLARNSDYNIYDAAMLGDLEKAKAFLKDKPDLCSSKDSDGATALDYAAMKGHPDMMELLVTAKADVNARDKKAILLCITQLATGSWMR